MSNKNENEDGFLLVSYKGRKKKCLKQFAVPSFIMEDTPNKLQNFNAVLKNIQDELKTSDFIVRFKEDLLGVLNNWKLLPATNQLDFGDDFSNIPDRSDSLNNSRQDVDIICYGLGQFSSCCIARYQLGFLLILRDILRAMNVYVYDPQFSAEEVQFLKELDLTVLSINEEAKRTLDRKSVCFMPHCDLPLYNNLLWANWDVNRLSDVVIIGNSFQNYDLNDAKGVLRERAKYVYLANKFATEIRMANVFRFSDVFNDLSIHYFKTSSLSSVDPFVWSDAEEPEYCDGDEIIKSV